MAGNDLVGSGGISLAGTAAVKLNAASTGYLSIGPIQSAGVIGSALSSIGPVQPSYLYHIPSGGLGLSGSAVVAFGVPTSGGLNLSGSGSTRVGLQYDTSNSGGVALAGSTTIGLVGSGSLSISGSITAGLQYDTSNSGGVTLAGSTTIGLGLVGSGSLSISGSTATGFNVTTNNSYLSVGAIQSAGVIGSALSSVGAVQPSYLYYIPSGGLGLSGSMAFGIELGSISSGGLNLSGSITTVIGLTGSGGLNLSGSPIPGLSISTSGGLNLSGSPIPGLSMSTSGGLNLNGSTTPGFSYVAIGGLNLKGSIITGIGLTGSGGLIFTGIASTYLNVNYASSGGLNLDGSATRGFIGSGGLNLNGSTIPGFGYLVTGGLNLNGSATRGFIGSGGLSTSGSALLYVSFQAFPDGGVKFSGIATKTFKAEDYIEFRLEVVGTTNILVPGCEPLSEVTSKSLLTYQTTCGLVDLKTALAVIPGSRVDFGDNWSGAGATAGTSRKWFVLPRRAQTCPEPQTTDWYAVLRSLATIQAPLEERMDACDTIGQGYCPSPDWDDTQKPQLNPYYKEDNTVYGGTGILPPVPWWTNK